jgi:predicted HAD superfamily hydrolase
MQPVSRVLKEPSIKLFSVDVFDTLLRRTTKPELQRFSEISGIQAKYLREQGISSVSQKKLYLLRKEASRVVYSTKKPLFGAREASWEEIIKLMLQLLEINPNKSLLIEFERLELEYERLHLKANKSLLNTLYQARDSEKEVVCLSDMYLNSRQIVQLLELVTERDFPFHVYSSADYGYGKASGELYSTLARDYGVKLNEIYHCGDNYQSDHEIPSSLGISSSYMPRSFIWKSIHYLRKSSFNTSKCPSG